MNEIEVILGLLVAMTALLGLANRLQIPYPILLVVGGLAIGFIPGLPRIELMPDLIFLLFLPPIIQSAAFFTPIRDFKANIRSISLLAVALVLFTTALVAVIAHWLIPGLTWPAAFVLGAIISPPDAVAATSIAQRLKLPRRIVTVLEGESLVNDATALVAYRVAIAAVVTGVFSWQDTLLQFVVASVGGVLVGLLIGWLGRRVLHFVSDTSITLIVSFLVAYVAYLLAEQIHASGVLAVVALGLYSGRFWSFEVTSAQTRVQVELVWDSVISLLNGLIFILIGLQLPRILEGLSNESWVTLLLYAVVISLSVILIRIIWVFPATYLPRMLIPKIRKRDPYPLKSHVAIIAWTGMRGVVSLAAALALPLTTESGAAFPQRDMIIFLTFSVIFATLVLQGLTLPVLIRWFKIEGDGSEEREESKARLVAAKAGMARLDELSKNDWVAQEMVDDLNEHYLLRIRRFKARYTESEETSYEERANAFERLQQELLQAELTAVMGLRDKGVINDEIMRRVQRELDFERLRLDNSHNREDHLSETA